MYSALFVRHLLVNGKFASFILAPFNLMDAACVHTLDNNSSE